MSKWGPTSVVLEGLHFTHDWDFENMYLRVLKKQNHAASLKVSGHQMQHINANLVAVTSCRFQNNTLNHHMYTNEHFTTLLLSSLFSFFFSYVVKYSGRENHKLGAIFILNDKCFNRCVCVCVCGVVGNKCDNETI